MPKGFLIAIDGIDGSGKTTMTDLVHDHLYARFKDRVQVIRNPGATVLGSEIRKLVKSVKADLKIDPVAERLLFCADNIQTIKDIVQPALNSGGIIVSDRWSFITDWAYAIPGGMNSGTLQMIQTFATPVKPDLYILLRCSFETSKQRMSVRNNTTLGTVQQRCRIEEKGDVFMRAVCEQYSNDTSETMSRARAMAKKVVIVDANEGLQQAKAAVLDAVDRVVTTE